MTAAPPPIPCPSWCETEHAGPWDKNTSKTCHRSVDMLLCEEGWMDVIIEQLRGMELVGGAWVPFIGDTHVRVEPFEDARLSPADVDRLLRLVSYAGAVARDEAYLL